MKRLLGITCAAAIAATSSWAEINISFTSNAGTVLSDVGTTNGMAHKIFLVYYSPDATIGFNNVDPLSPLSDGANTDLLLTPSAAAGPALDSGSLQGRVRVTLPVDFSSGVAGLTSGYLYIALFNQTFVSSVADIILPGTEFMIGPTLHPMTEQFPGPGVPASDNYGAVINSTGFGSATYTATQFSTSQTIVPEPATFSLFSFGLLPLLFRRLRKK